MKEFFKDLGTQVVAAILFGVSLMIAIWIAGKLVPSPPFF